MTRTPRVRRQPIKQPEVVAVSTVAVSTYISEWDQVSQFSLSAVIKAMIRLIICIAIIQLNGTLQLLAINIQMGYNRIPLLPDIPLDPAIEQYVEKLNSEGRFQAGSPMQVGLSETKLDHVLLSHLTDGQLPMGFDIDNGLSGDEITAILNTTVNVGLYRKNLEHMGDRSDAYAATINQVSYILATAQWESDHFKTLSEYGGPDYLVYLDGRLGNCPARQCGVNQFGEYDYVTYRGRGLVQVTGKGNYRKVAKQLGYDDEEYFVNNPEVFEQPEVASVVLVLGMYEGWYTGYTLSDFLSRSERFVQARRIVNGDTAKNGAAIANYAKGYRSRVKKFYDGLDL